MTDRSVTGTIFDIQRCSLHDGPGVRTTVFLKGCPLNCLWCHNPEGKSRQVSISFQPEKCIGCGACMSYCEHDAHTLQGGTHHLDRKLCRQCGGCAGHCVAGALEAVGRNVSVEEVMQIVLRDVPFYETSGGGLTLSGGEPLMQPDFCVELLKAAKIEKLHCCIETSGHASSATLERVTPLVDLFLFDYKETDQDRHKEFCGVDNKKILANLRALHEREAAIRLRCPIIPSLNDREEHFEGIVQLLNELPGTTVELIGYHSLGASKSDRFGIASQYKPSGNSSAIEVENAWATRLKDRGFTVVNES